MPTGSRIETRLEEGKAVISVFGLIDGKAISDEIGTLVQSGIRQIDLDLGGVKGLEGIDSTAVGGLVALVIFVRNCGAKVSLVNLPRKLYEVLEIADRFK